MKDKREAFMEKMHELIEEEFGESIFFMVVVDEDGKEFHFGFGCEKCMADTLKEISKELGSFPHVKNVEEFIKKNENN